MAGEEEAVSITHGLQWTELRISCPDATGLGCDIARLMFEFGLTVTKGDFSTDGKWCFLLFHVANRSDETRLWTSFRHRLEEVCTPAFRGLPGEEDGREALARAVGAGSAECYLLKVDTADRAGALFDVVTVLNENDIMVHRAHASTSPIGRAIDLFYISDQRKELPAQARVDQLIQCTCERLSDASCTITIGRAPDVLSSFNGTFLTLAPSCVDNKSARAALSLHRSSSSSSSLEGGGSASSHVRRFSSDSGETPNCGPSAFEGEDQSMLFGGKVEVDIDNKLSRVHTVIQMRSKDRKGLLYDLLRTLKDVNTQVSYGKIEVEPSTGLCQMDVFVQEVNGAEGCTRIADSEMQQELCIRVHQALACPVRISAVNLGSDEMCTQLIVGAAVDSGGRGRPRVLYDTSKVLKQMSLSVFKMDMYLGNGAVTDKVCTNGNGNGDTTIDACAGTEKEEVHRFIVTDANGQPIPKAKLTVLASRVHDALMDVV